LRDCSAYTSITEYYKVATCPALCVALNAVNASALDAYLLYNDLLTPVTCVAAKFLLKVLDDGKDTRIKRKYAIPGGIHPWTLAFKHHMPFSAKEIFLSRC
jgi:hypothetical protein